MSSAPCAIDHSHDPAATSWVKGADAHPDFPVQNLPLGVFSPNGAEARMGTAIGDFILDLRAVAQLGQLPAPLAAALHESQLNALFALPAADRLTLRHRLFALLTDPTYQDALGPHLFPAKDCALRLPARVGDYTDFYVGIHHATHIGRQFRPETPLLPNYKYVPIGYHGRASSIRVSGAPVPRPTGQIKAPAADAPQFAPCQRLDYELELGVWIAGENPLGQPVPIAAAADRIAGLCLLNDWSARDIQAWEYQPLGPFLAKNFLTTLSPWVVTAEALAPFRISQQPRPKGDPQPLAYLWDETDQASGAFSITLQASLSTATMRAHGLPDHKLSTGPASNMYWTVAQMIAHHTANGCNLMPGDLLGTGTISGPDPDSLGSLMEITEGGKYPIHLPTGETRGFLEAGDRVSLHGQARRDGYRTIGFGPCAGTVG
ncbi:MAG: fumarylacetoacetase [Chakrabartia sp.]